jgi:hypothetical protein
VALLHMGLLSFLHQCILAVAPSLLAGLEGRQCGVHLLYWWALPIQLNLWCLHANRASGLVACERMRG